MTDKQHAPHRITSHYLVGCLFVTSLCCFSPFAFAEYPHHFRSLKEIREQGVVMQQWESSCAAAAIATVLTYGFNDPISERHAAASMLEKTDPQKVRMRGGFSLLDLKNFVVERGYQGNAYKHLGFEDLRAFHAPIVPINQHGYRHYVVFNSVRNGRVMIADPAFGNRELSIERFSEIWIDGMAFIVTRPTSLKERHE